MREKHFQIDIEATDARIADDEDILQVASLEADFGEDGFWHAGKEFELLLHTDKKPVTDFAKENLWDLYRRCNEAPTQTSEEVRQKLLEFFKSCGIRIPYVYLMGWNLGSFDVPFLHHKKYLQPMYRNYIGGKEVKAGDHHYRLYEQSGSISTAQCVLHIGDRNLLIDMALANSPGPVLPQGRLAHDALYDCYKQLRIENGIIRILRD